MKQLVFMIATTLFGTVGAFRYGPFCGVAVYYLFAVLRPQFIWEWTLPEGIQWSLFVALASIISVFLFSFSPGATRDDTEGAESPEVHPLSGAHRIVLLFGFWIGITFFTATDREVAYPYFIEYLKIFVMFYVAARAIWTLGEVWILFLIIAVSLGYISYEVNDIYFNQGGYITIYRRGYGGLDNNGAALMLAMGVPLCFFAWEGIQKWYRWGFVLAIPVLLHAIMMSFSRGAMLSLVVTLPVYLLRSRRWLQVLAIMGVVAFLVPILAGNEIRARFSSISDSEADDSANSRRTSWAIGWRMATENPVFGLGIRNANLFAYAYGADMEGRTIHSQYIQTAADSGLVALILYLAAFGAVWWSLRKVRKATAHRFDPEGIRAYAIACGIEGSMAVFAFGAIFLSLENFELPYLLLLLGAQLPTVLPPVMEEPTSQTLDTATDA
jgi:probable O-glycosylation ligase (exosortase A-associated)